MNGIEQQALQAVYTRLLTVDEAFRHEENSTDANSESHSECDDSDHEHSDTRDNSYSNDCSDSSEDFVFEGSTITFSTAIILILSFITKHRLAGSVISDLVDLLNVFCVGFKLTVNKLNNWIDSSKYAIEKHYYCANCLYYIQDPNVINVCPVPGCNKPLQINDKFLSYIS
jgi:hypothetical protein